MNCLIRIRQFIFPIWMGLSEHLTFCKLTVRYGWQMTLVDAILLLVQRANNFVETFQLENKSANNWIPNVLSWWQPSPKVHVYFALAGSLIINCLDAVMFNLDLVLRHKIYNSWLLHLDLEWLIKDQCDSLQTLLLVFRETNPVLQASTAPGFGRPRRFHAKRRWPRPKAWMAPLTNMLDF